jgi:Fe-S-cluster containining protein
MGVLKGRTPTLEHPRYADLQPVMAEYGHLVDKAETLVQGKGVDQRCGREHDLCCCMPVCLSLVEAAYLLQQLNKVLSHSQREHAIERASLSDAQEDAIRPELHPLGGFCFSRREEYLCPLWIGGRCILYQHRPLQCRTFELDARTKTDFWDSELHPALADLSRVLFHTLAGKEPPDTLPTFSISCVVSGRYVQEFFHLLKG